MDIIPALILAKTAHLETVDFFRAADSPFSNDIIKDDIKDAIHRDLTVRATHCLRTACAARDLRMIVIEPETKLRFAVPSEYFENKYLAEIEFTNNRFLTSELSKRMISLLSEKLKDDPLFEQLRGYRGWAHGFVEAEFRAWLENPNIGPLAGARLERVFHIDPRDASSDPPTKAELDQRMAPQVMPPDKATPMWDAVVRVQSHYGLSVGAAQVAICEACASGAVRVYPRPILQSRLPYGPKTAAEWRDARIDLDHLELVCGENSYQLPRISQNDLDWWFENSWSPEHGHLAANPEELQPQRTKQKTWSDEQPAGWRPQQMPTEADHMVQSRAIPLIEAVHDLRTARDISVQTAISDLVDMLATGQLPPASALIEDTPTKIDPRWWWASPHVAYPNSTATFNLVQDGQTHVVRATEVSLGREAWEQLVLSIRDEAIKLAVEAVERTEARAEAEFQNPYWSLGSVLSWIAFRDPALICQFDSRRHFAARARRYGSTSPPLPFVEGGENADASLLIALKKGQVTAIKDGTEIPSTGCYDKYTIHLSDNLRFRRAEVMKHWQARSVSAARPTDAVVSQWMNANVDRTVKRDPTLLACRCQTGATHRQALKAWNQLPEDQRRKRGGRDRIAKSDK